MRLRTITSNLMRAVTLVKHKAQHQALTPQFNPSQDDYYCTLTSDLGTIIPLNGVIALHLANEGDLGNGGRDWRISGRTGTICMAADPTICMAVANDPNSGEKYIKLSRFPDPMFSQFLLMGKDGGGYAILLRQSPRYGLFPGVEGHALTLQKIEKLGSEPAFHTHNVEPIVE